jgi:transaldolase
MKFFIDTANVGEIRAAWDIGVIDGVTTNPSLIAREKRDAVPLYQEICGIVDGPINAEVISTATDEMVREGEKLAAIHENIVVKIPMTVDGLRAVRQLSAKGISTNVTLIFSANQALLAAKAGAHYVSPFVGRLDDISQIGMDVVADIQDIFENYAFDCEVIVASVRNPVHVLEAARMGADIATIPYGVIAQLAKHPLTDIGLEKFLKDWENAQKK